MDYTRLEMIFNNSGGSKKTISVYDPKDTLTDAEVQQAMTDLLAKNVFTSGNGDFISINSARIVTRDITELNVA
jgi:hypothetical protein